MENLAIAIPVFARIAGALAVAPGFGFRVVPMKVRLAAAAVLTPALLPSVPALAPEAAGSSALVALTIEQVAIGLGLGFAASLFFYGVAIAGQLADRQLAFFFSGAFAPTTGGQRSPLGAFYFMFAVVVFFAIDGHHALLSGLARSFAALPIAGSLPAGASADAFCGLTGTLFVAALQVGAPIVAAIFIADVAIALASRVAPSLQSLVVGLPLRCGVGLFAVAMSLPLIVGAVRSYAAGIAEALPRLFQAG